jgi:hypothetical protein
MSARKAQMVLDLTGIWDAPKMSAPAPAAPVEPKKKKKLWKTAKRYSRYLWVMCLILFLWLIYRWISRSTSRHIRHIPCKQRRGAYICKVPARWTGDVVVEMTEECANHVFEIGGVPFTHARWNNMFRVPVVSEVRILDAFTGCNPRAFVDNQPVMRKETDDLVWCAAKDHTLFSVDLDGDSVLEDASGSLMSPQTNGIWTCYTYTLTARARNIKITGNGNTEIHVYNRPKIVVNKYGKAS